KSRGQKTHAQISDLSLFCDCPVSNLTVCGFPFLKSPGRRRDYSLLIPFRCRALCREKQLLLRFFDEGSSQSKLNWANVARHGAEAAGRLLSTWCSSRC